MKTQIWKLGVGRWQIGLFLFVLLHSVFSLHAQSYSIDWYKVASGGGTSTNGQYSVTGTIGQPDASGAMSSGQYSVTGGFWSLIQVAQTPGAPLLTITYSANQAIISWPSPSAGFTLQTNGNLTTGTWMNYGDIIGDNGTIKSVTNSPPTGTLFFRLKSP
jgi:hypothetical protein